MVDKEYTLVAASTTMKSVLRMDARQGQVFVGPSDPINTSSQSGLSVNKFQLNLPPQVWSNFIDADLHVFACSDGSTPLRRRVRIGPRTVPVVCRVAITSRQTKGYQERNSNQEYWFGWRFCHKAWLRPKTAITYPEEAGRRSELGWTKLRNKGGICMIGQQPYPNEW